LTFTIATSEVEAFAFREKVYSELKIPLVICPPKKALILYRSEPTSRRRLLLNVDQVFF